jgi:methionyl-tRNA formyltransferase
MSAVRGRDEGAVRRVAFVGDRIPVYEVAREFRALRLDWIWALEGSRLASHLEGGGQPHRVFGRRGAANLLAELKRTPFDILVSNGCPLRIPLASLRRPGRLFLNVHPSVLPELKGMHPVNGVFLLEGRPAGATMHFMTEDIDAGNVIAQRRVEVTDDLDLGLLYHLVFRAEADVFREGMGRLIESGFRFEGTPQSGAGSVYTRRPEDMQLDVERMLDQDIERRVRAFGVRTQAATCMLGDRAYRIIDARPVRNPGLLDEYRDLAPGSLALAYDGKLLVRTRQGLMVLVPIEEVVERDRT